LSSKYEKENEKDNLCVENNIAKFANQNDNRSTEIMDFIETFLKNFDEKAKKGFSVIENNVNCLTTKINSVINSLNNSKCVYNKF